VVIYEQETLVYGELLLCSINWDEPQVQASGMKVNRRFHKVRVREDVRIKLACPTSSVVTMVTTGMKLQLSLFLL